jgi:hypothetical protein
MTPGSAQAGSAATVITVGGTDFIASSTVIWNESALATTYVSSTSLTAVVPASDLLSAGSAMITVENPSPGGGTSNGKSFTVNPHQFRGKLLSVWWRIAWLGIR